jgi:hypothetical protein
MTATENARPDELLSPARRRLSALAIAVLAVAALIAFPADDAGAHEHQPPFLWWPLVSADTSNANSDYPAEIFFAINQWWGAGAPIGDYCAPGPCGNIQVWENTFGMIWIGLAYPFKFDYFGTGGYVPCVDFFTGQITGACHVDPVWERAEFAYIFLDDMDKPLLDMFANAIISHEIGHVWGLAHVPSGTPSVMNQGTVDPVLKPHDFEDIANAY